MSRGFRLADVRKDLPAPNPSKNRSVCAKGRAKLRKRGGTGILSHLSNGRLLGHNAIAGGAEGQIRTGTRNNPQRFLRPPRLPFRHFGRYPIVCNDASAGHLAQGSMEIRKAIFHNPAAATEYAFAFRSTKPVLSLRERPGHRGLAPRVVLHPGYATPNQTEGSHRRIHSPNKPS